MANIYASSAGNTAPHPFASDGVSTWSATRPPYLWDLRNATNVHTESINMGARTIDGAKFDHDIPNFTLQPDAVQSWSIGGAAQHPFHLQVYHVQANGCGGDYEDGELYDVIASNCNVRFDLNAATSSVYAGRTIMHCHILEHEDQGAMGWANVLGGIAPPTFPSDSEVSPAYAEYYVLTGSSAPVAPSNLSATATSSSQIDLAWTDNSSDETSFSIERSTDGVNFSSHDAVGTDITTYTDTGLLASTTYTYRVRSTNTVGSSLPSNTASATTQSQGSATSADVGSITISTVNAGGGKKKGQAAIIVVDNLGNPVANATVTGTFTGSFNETTTSGPTDTSGSTSVQTTSSKSGQISLTFCVTNITHPSLTNFSGNVCSSL